MTKIHYTIIFFAGILGVVLWYLQYKPKALATATAPTSGTTIHTVGNYDTPELFSTKLRPYTKEIENLVEEGKLRFEYQLLLIDTVLLGTEKETKLIGRIINDSKYLVSFLNFSCNGDMDNLLFNEGGLRFSEPFSCSTAAAFRAEVAANSTYTFECHWVDDYNKYETLKIDYQLEAIPTSMKVYEAYERSEVNTLKLVGKRVGDEG